MAGSVEQVVHFGGGWMTQAEFAEYQATLAAEGKTVANYRRGPKPLRNLDNVGQPPYVVSVPTVALPQQE